MCLVPDLICVISKAFHVQYERLEGLRKKLNLLHQRVLDYGRCWNLLAHTKALILRGSTTVISRGWFCQSMIYGLD